MSKSPTRKRPPVPRRVRRQTPARPAPGEDRLADLLDHAPIGLLWADPSGRILRLNRTLAGLLNLAGVGDGLHLRDLFADDSQLAGWVRQLQRGRPLHDLRSRLKCRGDGLIHVLIDADSVRDTGDGSRTRWFIRDISQSVELEREVLGVSEREQRRIGQDLHDDLCQELACIEYLCQALQQKLNGVSASEAERAAEIGSMLRHAIHQTRELARGLFPVDLEADGLMNALQRLASRTSDLYHVDCRFRCPRPVLIHDNILGVNLFRIAQEAVGNALRHGTARRIEIALRLRNRRIHLQIKDDGRGLPRNEEVRNGRGLGLQIMQYRVGMMNGIWSVESQPGAGVTVSCTVPTHLG